MKTRFISAFFVATFIPAIALGSPAMDRVSQSMHQPLSAKTSTTVIQPTRVENALGQSDTMTRTQYLIGENTKRPTQYQSVASTKLVSAKPIDW